MTVPEIFYAFRQKVEDHFTKGKFSNGIQRHIPIDIGDKMEPLRIAAVDIG